MSFALSLPTKQVIACDTGTEVFFGSSIFSVNNVTAGGV
jgi:hypothetical protein